MQGPSFLRSEAPEWDLDFSIRVTNGMPAEKFGEGPNIGPNFSGTDLRHARGCIFEDCTSPDKTDTEIWLTNAVCYRSECCTAFKVASRHKTAAPYRLPSIYSVCSLELRYAF